jgi:ATP-binding cassette subfamily B protein
LRHNAIDAHASGAFDLKAVLVEFFSVSVLIGLLTYGQSVTQVIASERVARDLRTRIVEKVSRQDYEFVERVTPSKLLTNLTSDVDSVKSFVSQAVSSIVSSIFLIFGASILLLMIDWKLALAVLAVVPIIGFAFAYVLGRVRKLFKVSQETVDWLNRIINESILGAALIRLLNSPAIEFQKFLAANTKSREISFSILILFATLIPVIMLTSNLALLIILVL